MKIKFDSIEIYKDNRLKNNNSIGCLKLDLTKGLNHTFRLLTSTLNMYNIKTENNKYDNALIDLRKYYNIDIIKNRDNIGIKLWEKDIDTEIYFVNELERISLSEFYTLLRLTGYSEKYGDSYELYYYGTSISLTRSLLPESTELWIHFYI